MAAPGSGRWVKEAEPVTLDDEGAVEQYTDIKVTRLVTFMLPQLSRNSSHSFRPSRNKVLMIESNEALQKLNHSGGGPGFR